MNTPAILAAASDSGFDPNSVTPGLLGFLVFCGLGVATWFLVKSMNGQFKRIDFAEEPEQPKE
ncbi:hypothetical protein [Kitasatospora sp. LaBMicrA B282]|uniref:hypothetical protein n=1 Tax=Kitasatospora sp. LaBMicrA B282 TaxID=3420949 RepID=UPI003D1413EC